jgi:hypothetical protein
MTGTYADLGVRRTRPGERPGTYWAVMFMGGRVQNAVTYEFHAEPQGSAIQTIREHLGAAYTRIIEPTVSITDLIRRGIVCATCADEGERECGCWDMLKEAS